MDEELTPIQKAQAARRNGPKKSQKKDQIIRWKDGKLYKIKGLTRKKSIDIFCSTCMPDDNPKDCTSPYCPHFEFRPLNRIQLPRNAKEVSE